MIGIFLYIIIAIFVFHVFTRLTCGISTNSACLIGKTAIVTGGNAGIGFQIAKILASRGCKVILADKSNSEKSKQRIINETNNNNIITRHLDLSSLDSVRKFADCINKTEERLDILINNAGIGWSKTFKTGDKLNAVMQINFFGHFLLTHLLIDLLKKSTPSRILFTSSSLAFLNNLTPENFNTFDDFDFPIVPYNLTRNYSNSKMACLIASNEIANRLKGTGITCNAVHPGIVRTGIIADTLSHISLIKVIVDISNLISAKNTWEGAQTNIEVATATHLKSVTGKYFWDCKEMIMPPLAKNKTFCEWMYKESERLVNLTEIEKLPKSI